jgi:eukaryotic-like serine/threonine-protein kinase
VLVTVRATRHENDLWAWAGPGIVESRLTFARTLATFGVWASDASAVVYSRLDRGVFRLFQKSANGAGEERRLSDATSAWGLFPEDQSRDGAWLVYTTNGPLAWDLGAMDLATATPRPLIATVNNEIQGRVSPDGKWLAYASDEAGRWDVYLTAFPSGAGRWQVSAAGGSLPEWRADGKEIYFIAADGHLTAASVRIGTAPEVGARAMLFQTPLASPLAPFRSEYAVAADGQRFLINTTVPDATPQSITVVIDPHRGQAPPSR